MKKEKVINRRQFTIGLTSLLLTSCLALTPPLPPPLKRYICLEGGKFQKIKTRQGEVIEIHYRQKGNPENPNLLLLHGIAGSINTWNYIINQLSTHFHTTAFDFKGCGNSNVTQTGYHPQDKIYETEQLIQALKIERTALIGQSLGAIIAAGINKELVNNKLVYISGTLPKITTGLNDKIERASKTPLAKHLTNSGIAREFLEDLYHNKENITAEHITEKVRNLKRDEYFEAFTKTCSLAKQYVSKELTLNQLQKALRGALWIHGRQDSMFTITDNWEELLSAYYPETKGVVLEDCGHFVTHEQPEQFTKTALEYLLVA